MTIKSKDALPIIVLTIAFLFLIWGIKNSSIAGPFLGNALTWALSNLANMIGAIIEPLSSFSSQIFKLN